MAGSLTYIGRGSWFNNLLGLMCDGIGLAFSGNGESGTIVASEACAYMGPGKGFWVYSYPLYLSDAGGTWLTDPHDAEIPGGLHDGEFYIGFELLTIPGWGTVHCSAVGSSYAGIIYIYDDILWDNWTAGA